MNLIGIFFIKSKGCVIIEEIKPVINYTKNQNHSIFFVKLFDKHIDEQKIEFHNWPFYSIKTIFY